MYLQYFYVKNENYTSYTALCSGDGSFNSAETAQAVGNIFQVTIVIKLLNDISLRYGERRMPNYLSSLISILMQSCYLSESRYHVEH